MSSSDLSSLLAGGIILSRLQATSRKQVLCDLAAALANRLGLDPRDVREAVMERERLGSTGVGSGVAIPHARIEGLSRTVGGFARLDHGVNFEAVDNHDCDLIFMLLAPHDDGADHLRALARVSRVFRLAEVRQALREARTDADIAHILMPPALKDPTVSAA